jgi:hypothetical protein
MSRLPWLSARGPLRAAVLGIALSAAARPTASLSAQSNGSQQPVTRATAVQAPAAVPSFSVTDQFDRLFTEEAMVGTPVLFLVASRDGADAARRWSSALAEPARARGVRIVNVADLKGAPRLLKGVIRRGFPKDTTDRILMDFDGRLGRTLRGERLALVAVLYGADGRLQRAVELPTSGPDRAISNQLLGPARQP